MGEAIRLSKAAKEFNVGISTIVEFLHKKGHQIPSDPNHKITGDMYDLVVKEYSVERKFKNESQKLDLNKLRQKREAISVGESADEDGEQDEVLIHDVSSSSARPVSSPVHQEEPPIAVKVVGKIDLNPKPQPKTQPKQDTQPEVKVPEKLAPEKKLVITEEPQKHETHKHVEKEPVMPEPVAEIPKKETETIEKAVVVDEKEKSEPEPSVKVVGKIDLTLLNQKTRPDKKTKEQKEDERRERKKDRTETTVVSNDDTSNQKAVGDVSSQESAGAQPDNSLYRSKVEKLSGPTIVGKIDLTIHDRKPVASSDDDKKKKKKRRKRIRKDRVEIAAPGTPQAPKAEGDDKSKKPQPKQKVATIKKRPLKAEVNEEDVQKQIKDTLARLTSKGKSKGSKYRREKRDFNTQRQAEESERQEAQKNILKVTEFVSVNELASMMNVSVNDVISVCMNLGLFVSINQRLDAETMALVAEEFNYKMEFVSADVLSTIKEEEDKPEDLLPRSPIVTVMGHVDHGKTSLLDYIRHANVIAGEAGGITQHIGAYSVQLPDDRIITFLDTPGHEAFTAMRARGAKITDVAIIVVAADDSVMPQTIEAINHASAANVPIVFAINKIDKPGANPEKIKEALSNLNYLVEDWGGKYQSQEISAKKGVNIELLLEKVLLEAELLNLHANPNRDAYGTVVESSLDKGRGYTATVLVQNGTLKIGDIVLAGCQFGHVKAMYNERGQKITEAGPSTPVQILGLDGAPQAGDRFNVMESDREAKEIATKRLQLQREQGMRTQKHITLDEIGRRIAIGNFQELNIIVKGDVDGSVEALSDSLIKLSNPEIQLNVIHKAVGQISESDILLAAASNAIIIGFQVRPSLSARKLAEKEQIDIRLYSIIYDAINELKDAMEGMLSPEVKEEINATLEIREVFKITKVGTIAGCMVKEGKIKRTSKVRIIRDGIVVYTGNLGSLKRFKDDVKEVVTGLECGLNIENFNDIKAGDMIEAFSETEIKRLLK